MAQITCRRLSQVSDSKTASRSSKCRQTTPPDRASSPKFLHSSPSAAVRSLYSCGKYYVPISSVDGRRQRGLSTEQDRAMPCARFTAQQFSIFASHHLSDQNQTFSVQRKGWRPMCVILIRDEPFSVADA